MAPTTKPAAGEAQLAKAYHNKDAPLTSHKQKVMVKVTAPKTASGDTAELDIVAVLDTSGSMRHGNRLKHMKAAMDFVITKLGKNDSLAIVNFDSVAHTYDHYKMPKQLKEKNSEERKYAVNLVNGLHAKGDTNIEAGLRAGIDILSSRGGRQENRAACIFLMSDGAQNKGDARKVLEEMPNWTVHTFGFGEKHDETLLWEIARKSHAGVYHHVLDEGDQLMNYLTKAFAHSLAVYRSISMMKLKVTLTPNKEADSTIVSVDAGGYQVGHPKDNLNSWTIDFGDLAREENRRIIIDVQLPKVPKKEGPKPIMEVQYAYIHPARKADKKKAEETRGPKPPLVIEIGRDDAKGKPGDMNPDVKREVARNRQAEFIEKMLEFADHDKKTDRAEQELETAKSELSGLKDPKGESVIKALHAELDNIGDFLEPYDDYKKLGRAYMLACLSSHRRQRYAERGGADDVPLFLTGRMKKYKQHADDHHKNPNATHI